LIINIRSIHDARSEKTSSYDMIYLLTAIGLTTGGSSTVHIYTQTIHRTTQLSTLFGRHSGIEPRVVKQKLTIN